MFISAHPKSRRQRTWIGSAFSDYLNILFGVSQEFILSPILFIIFLSDFFYIYRTIWITRAMMMIPLVTFADRIMLKLLSF